MSDSDSAVSKKSRKALSVVHWLLMVCLACFVAYFAYMIYVSAGTISKYGYPSTLEIDTLLSIVVVVAAILLFDRVIRDLRSGKPPFTRGNASAFLLIAVMIFIKTIVSLIVQTIVYNHNTILDMPVYFSVDAVMAGLVLLLLYFIIDYGSKLQAEVEDLV